MDLKNLYFSYLEATQEEEERRKSYIGILVDENGEEFLDEEAYNTYWDGIQKEL